MSMEIAFKVRPCSRADLRSCARKIWQCFQIKGNPFPIVQVIESIPIIDPVFNFEIVPDQELQDGVHALWDPVSYLMTIKESVYNGACAGKGRDRMTLAHELGHYTLHTDQYPQMCRQMYSKEIRLCENSEWQAKAFAAELLIPADRLRDNSTLDEIVNIYGVSYDAAEVQLKVLKRERGAVMKT